MARPGGQLAALPLHFVWIADCSGSMAAEGRIESLNHAAREALAPMRKVAAENPNAEVLVRVLRFASGATWVVENPTPVRYFQWPELTAVPGDVTDLGAALTLLARELRSDTMAPRALPPVLALLSDGYPTDDYVKGLESLMSEPWGAKAVRIAIMIGNDGPDEVMQRFIGDPKVAPLRATNADELVRYIRWASTSVLQSVSAPRGGSGPDLRPPAAGDPGQLPTW